MEDETPSSSYHVTSFLIISKEINTLLERKENHFLVIYHIKTIARCAGGREKTRGEEGGRGEAGGGRGTSGSSGSLGAPASLARFDIR